MNPTGYCVLEQMEDRQHVEPIFSYSGSEISSHFVPHFVFIWAASTFQIIVVIAMAEDDENLDNGHEFHLWLLGVQPRMSEWTPAWLDDNPENGATKHFCSEEE